MRTLAPNCCDLRLVDLVKTQHVVVHPSPSPKAAYGLSHSDTHSR
jgi:hypothetical protein